MKKIMLEKKTWAVVGANNNTRKFGYMVFKRLKDNGYKVYPVNPKYDHIDGDVSYSNISDLPEIPEVLNMVVAPEYGIVYIKEAAKLGIKYIWFQPGTFNKEIFKLIKDKEMKAVQACVLNDY